MIWESRYWKNELLRFAKQLRGKRSQQRWTEDSGAIVEKAVFIGFYSIRKLLDAQKVSEALRTKAIACRVYSPTGKNVTRLSRLDFPDLYDMAAPAKATLPVRHLCNQIIHSYVFALGGSKAGNWAYIYVASDTHRKKALYEIRATTVIRLFETFGNNYPSRGQFVPNERNGDYDFRD